MSHSAALKSRGFSKAAVNDENIHSIDKSRNYHLGKILVESGVISEQELEMAVQLSHMEGINVLESISKLGFLHERDLLKALINARQKDSVFSFWEGSFDFRKFTREMESRVKGFKYNLVKNVSRSRNQCVFDVVGNTVKVAVSALSDVVAKQKTQSFYEKLGYKVEFYAATGMDLALLQDRVYREKDGHDLIVSVLAYEAVEMDMENVLALIAEKASLENASDIYFVYKNSGVSYLYFRINRRKRFVSLVKPNMAEKLAMYIKQMSGMDAGRLKGHQDGSLSINILDNRYVITARISWITTISGGQMTIRLQDEERPRLSDLGFDSEDVQRIKQVLNARKGIVILSGVTGSGKTTTLYSMLNHFNPNENNIITMEDPVEIYREGINQVEINDLAGQSFSKTIRASLRQAPDIILLGEIRDSETALRAMEAALTGHLVLTTLHCPNVIPGIRLRLEELGVENIDGLMRLISLAIYQELIPSEEKGLELAYEISTDMKNVKKVRL